MNIFAIESSCDETSVCIIKENKDILSHITYSQQEHGKFGGVSQRRNADHHSLTRELPLSLHVRPRDFQLSNGNYRRVVEPLPTTGH